MELWKKIDYPPYIISVWCIDFVDFVVYDRLIWEGVTYTLRKDLFIMPL